MHLLLTRPDAGAEPDALTGALAAAGHRLSQAPLLAIVPTGARPALNGVGGLIVTSRNALKSLAPFADTTLALTLYAVGPGTGALARALGFRHVIEGPGTGRELAALIASKADPAAGPLVHLAGETLAFDLKGALAGEGFTVRIETVYRAEPASALPADIVSRFQQGAFDGVVLMSPRTAETYARLITEAALGAAARKTLHFCLSDAVGRALAALDGVSVAVARRPTSEEMLALIAGKASDFP